MRRAQDGFSLIELLIAGAILIAMLAMLGTIYVGTQRSYRLNETVSNERQSIQAVTELLQYEIGLAGYRCADSVANATSRVFSTTPVTAVDGASGAPDEVTVRYYEDRFAASSCSLSTVRFYVSNGKLWRDANGTAAPAVNGVTDLQVSSWLDASNIQFNVPVSAAGLNRPADADLAGMGITLVLEDGNGRSQTEVVTIGFKNPQCANVADCA